MNTTRANRGIGVGLRLTLCSAIRLAGVPRRATVILFVLAAMLSSFAHLSNSAAAYPRTPNAGCALNSVNLNFNTSEGPWPTAARDAVADGADYWNNTRDWNGNTFWTGGIGNTHQAYRQELGYSASGNSINGSVTCPGIAFPDALVVRFDNDPSGDFLKSIASHEVGHAFGMNHSGKDDNNSSKLPMMATCLSQSQATDRLGHKGRDDFGGPIAIEHFGVGSNQSFENFKKTWATNQPWVVKANGGSEGSRYAQLNNPKSGTSIRNWVRNQVPADEYDARINARAPSTDGYTGSIRLKMESLRIDYPAGGDCSYPDGLNYNDPTITQGWLTVKQVTVNPSASWNYWTTSDWVVPGSWEAVDVRVKVEFLGGTGKLHIDNTRPRSQ